MSSPPRDGIIKKTSGHRKCAKRFTLFPQLPTELQLVIWEFASIPEPRMIELHGELRPLSDLYAERTKKDCCDASAVSYTWGVPPIGVLGACRNARDLGRHLYRDLTFRMHRNFVSKSSNTCSAFQPSGSIMIEPSQDVFLYAPRTLREMMDIRRKLDTTMIKHLALSLDGKDLVHVGLEAFDNYLSLALGGFTNLETIELVLGRTQFAYPHFTEGQLIEIDVSADGSTRSKFEDTIKHCGLEAMSYMTDWAKTLKKSFLLWKDQQPGPWQFMNNLKPTFNFKVSCMARKTSFPDNHGLWFVEYWQWATGNSTKTVGHKDYGDSKFGKWVAMPIARDMTDFRKGDDSKILKLFSQYVKPPRGLEVTNYVPADLRHQQRKRCSQNSRTSPKRKIQSQSQRSISQRSWNALVPRASRILHPT